MYNNSDNNSDLPTDQGFPASLSLSVANSLNDIARIEIGANGTDLLVPHLWTPSQGIINDNQIQMDLLFVDIGSQPPVSQRVMDSWDETIIDNIYNTFLADLESATDITYPDSAISLQFSFSLLFNNFTGITTTWMKNDQGESAIRFDYTSWQEQSGYAQIVSTGNIGFVKSDFDGFITLMNSLVNPLDPYL